jgi:hypothetical protein
MRTLLTRLFLLCLAASVVVGCSLKVGGQADAFYPDEVFGEKMGDPAKSRSAAGGMTMGGMGGIGSRKGGER